MRYIETLNPSCCQVKCSFHLPLGDQFLEPAERQYFIFYISSVQVIQSIARDVGVTQCSLIPTPLLSAHAQDPGNETMHSKYGNTCGDLQLGYPASIW